MDHLKPPVKLAKFQRDFRTIITASSLDTGTDLNSPSKKNFFEVIQEDPTLSKEARVRIYSYAWYARIQESLEEDYESLARSLGAKAFNRLIREYLKAYPSSSYTLVHTGDRLPHFLADWSHPKKKPWHVDLAKLERSFYQAFYAKDPENWNLQNLIQSSAENAERIQLSIAPSVSLMSSSWRISDVWKEKTSKAKKKECFCLVFRKGFTPSVKVISKKVYDRLKLLEKGTTLGEIIDAFPNQKTVQLLIEWASEGVVQCSFESGVA